MATIVAGRVDTLDQAGEIARRLYARRFGADDVSVFFLNPAAQHARFSRGGRRYGGARARRRSSGALLGLAAGLIAGAVMAAMIYRFLVSGGPLPVIAALLGGYGGALAGAFGRGRRRQARPPIDEARAAGVMVAAHVTAQTADVAMRVLRYAGADDLQRTEGRWEHGEWRDFSPQAMRQRPSSRQRWRDTP